MLISSADYLALEETTHLLRAPANARHLLESLKQARPVNNGRLDDYTVVMVTPVSIRFRRTSGPRAAEGRGRGSQRLDLGPRRRAHRGGPAYTAPPDDRLP